MHIRDKKFHKLQQNPLIWPSSSLSFYVLLPLRSIQWSLFDFAQRCCGESQLISQTCYRPKQGTSSHDIARFKWTLSETPWWCDVVGMCLQEQTNIWSHTSVNQYDSMCTTGYRKHPQTNGYRWLQILGQWKFPGAPCIRDSEHPSCKTLFHFHFERSGGSLGTNTSIVPSTLEDHHEPDSGTVQSNKELVVEKNSFQSEKKRIQKDSVTAG